MSFAIDPKTGQLSPYRHRTARRQHGEHRGRSQRQVPVQRLLWRQQGRAESASGNGVVGEPKQVIPTGLNAHAFLPSPDNRFVFATNLGSDQVLSFRVQCNDRRR